MEHKEPPVEHKEHAVEHKEPAVEHKEPPVEHKHPPAADPALLYISSRSQRELTIPTTVRVDNDRES